MKNKKSNFKKTIYKIFKCLGISLVSILVFSLVLILMARGINTIKAKITTENGIQEELYIEIGGIEQSIQIRGEDINNPVILFLHGGPGSPIAYISHYYQRDLEENYTVVNWDQRRSGRTYYANLEVDVEPELSLEILLNDVDEIVDYLNNRFGQENVIIMGHSWGTVLGSFYVNKHPEKISSYISIAQSINLKEGEALAVDEAMKLAKEDDNQEYIDELLPLFDKFSIANDLGNFDFYSHAKIRKLTTQYLSCDDSISTLHSLWLGASSPNMSFTDLKWYLKVMFYPDEFKEIQGPLLQSLVELNLSADVIEYKVPVYFIAGDCDWITPYLLIEEYYEMIKAPSKEIILIEDVGHGLFLDNPEEFSSVVKELLVTIKP